MENASKALIIAGAILIAIVLITLGVVILQQGDSMTGTGETALNAREIESFNSQFQKYELGTKATTGTNVKALINAVNSNKCSSNNAAQNNTGAGHAITLTGITTVGGVKPAQKYTVTCTDTDNNGYIDTISIAE